MKLESDNNSSKRHTNGLSSYNEDFKVAAGKLKTIVELFKSGVSGLSQSIGRNEIHFRNK
jgi:hypothetical protein